MRWNFYTTLGMAIILNTMVPLIAVITKLKNILTNTIRCKIRLLLVPDFIETAGHCGSYFGQSIPQRCGISLPD